MNSIDHLNFDVERNEELGGESSGVISTQQNYDPIVLERNVDNKGIPVVMNTVQESVVGAVVCLESDLAIEESVKMPSQKIKNPYLIKNHNKEKSKSTTESTTITPGRSSTNVTTATQSLIIKKSTINHHLLDQMTQDESVVVTPFCNSSPPTNVTAVVTELFPTNETPKEAITMRSRETMKNLQDSSDNEHDDEECVNYSDDEKSSNPKNKQPIILTEKHEYTPENTFASFHDKNFGNKAKSDLNQSGSDTVDSCNEHDDVDDTYTQETDTNKTKKRKISSSLDNTMEEVDQVIPSSQHFNSTSTPSTELVLGLSQPREPFMVSHTSSSSRSMWIIQQLEEGILGRVDPHTFGCDKNSPHNHYQLPFQTDSDGMECTNHIDGTTKNTNVIWDDDSFISYNKIWGRIYYSSFKLTSSEVPSLLDIDSTENGETFSIGDIIQLNVDPVTYYGKRINLVAGTNGSHNGNARIIACYKATKTLYSRCREITMEGRVDCLQVIQEQEYPYMEVCSLSDIRSSAECCIKQEIFLPICLLQSSVSSCTAIPSKQPILIKVKPNDTSQRKVATRSVNQLTLSKILSKWPKYINVFEVKRDCTYQETNYSNGSTSNITNNHENSGCIIHADSHPLSTDVKRRHDDNHAMSSSSLLHPMVNIRKDGYDGTIVTGVVGEISFPPFLSTKIPLIGPLKSFDKYDAKITWLPDSFVAHGDTMGRVYFDGFTRRTKNGTETYHMGDIVYVSDGGPSDKVQIVSCFQATKTFRFHNSTKKQEIFYFNAACATPAVQERGYAYMELRYIPSNNCLPEPFPPDWIQSPSLKITKQVQKSKTSSSTQNLEKNSKLRLSKQIEMLTAHAKQHWPDALGVFPSDDSESDDEEIESIVNDSESDDREVESIVNDSQCNDEDIDSITSESDSDFDSDYSDTDDRFTKRKMKKMNQVVVKIPKIRKRKNIDDDSFPLYDVKESSSIKKESDQKIFVKRYVQRICNEFNWTPSCYHLLSTYQLVWYNQHWAMSIDGSNVFNKDLDFTEAERRGLQELQISRKPIVRKFLAEIAITEMLSKPLECLVDIISEDDLPSQEEMEENENLNIKRARIRKRYARFNRLFYRVIEDIVTTASRQGEDKPDIILQAPCGSGKSSCFALASEVLGQITLVIEPLRALIDSQIKDLHSREIIAEKLYSHDDVKANQVQKHARVRLFEISFRYRHTSAREPRILFCTPEVFRGIKAEIKEFTRRGLMSLIVIDEFDFIEEASDKYRKDYLTLVTELRVTAPKVQLLFLSATYSKRLISQIIMTGNKGSIVRSSEKIRVYQTKYPLPGNHIYSVKRKSDIDAIALYIVEQLKHGRKKALCYCLTRANCVKMKNLLINHDISADFFHGNQTTEEQARVIKEFHSGKIQVVCATKSLGRGVHITCSIPFVFHVTLPISLTDYVQETGRGGRDGSDTHCVLFYRDQDHSVAQNIVLGHKAYEIEEGKKSELLSRITAVRHYAMEGKVCRYTMLAASCIPQANYNQRCKHSSCDNCRLSNNITVSDEQYEDISVNHIVTEIMKQERSTSDINSFYKATMGLTVFNTPRDKWLICSLLDYANKRRTISLLDLLYRAMKNYEKDVLESDAQFQERWLKMIKRNEIIFCLRNVRNPMLDTSQKDCDDLDVTPFQQQPESRILDIEEFRRTTPVSYLYPYLIQFELSRLGFNNEKDPTFWLQLEQCCKKGLSDACKYLYDKKKLPTRALFENLEGSTTSSLIFFSSTLVKGSNILKLNKPERAYDRRMYRHYGSDRFLEVSVSQSIELRQILRSLGGALTIGGRYFRYLWCKKDKSPQAYVFFAERGVGIASEDEVTVEQVMDRCIPKRLNPSLTISKFSKRMKLCFSTTTKGPVVNHDSIVILPDFNNGMVSEIDGAGLISQAGLELVWNEFIKNSGTEQGTTLPYSGFQGRIGGFKGVWVLDPSLGEVNGNDVIIQCRNSQCKYNSLSVHDDLQNTVEVCSWNKKLHAHLNTTAIQILEHQAKSIGKEEELLQVMYSCMQKTIDEIEDFCSEKSERLAKFLEEVNKSKCDRAEFNYLDQDDTRKLWLMFLANIPSDEPEYVRRKKRLLEKTFGRIRDEAHYPIDDSCTLRMVPDHTLLLEEGEAFLSLSGYAEANSNDPINDLIAMRFPSYFAGDIRRLKVVDLQTLEQRAESNVDDDIPNILKRNATDKVAFFTSMKYALILSVKGRHCEAFRMSGGDFDGDAAWICWNKSLLSCLPLEIMASPYLDESEVKQAQDICVWDSSIEDKLNYNYHFRHHNNDLCNFASLLDISIDKYGFDHEESVMLGKAAFVQVDIPYINPFRKHVDKTWPELPHWKNRKYCKTYQSQKLLGKMWNLMTKKMSCISELKNTNILPDKIRHLINMCTDKSVLEALRTKLRDEAVSYLEKREETRKQAGISKEEMFNWQERYCSQRREVLMVDNPFGGVHKNACAAVLYEQCKVLDAKGETHKNALEFAWYVAEIELRHIFLDSPSLFVDASRERLFHRHK